MSKLIYAADDEENIRKLVKSFLEREGYVVEVFPTGDSLLARFMERPCDLVILDIMMPGSDGFSVCSALRNKSNVPIIMLTARDSDSDYIAGITLGSDDYFTKPFSPMALVMRVKAIFRRIGFEKSAARESKEISFGDLTVNLGTKTVLCGGQPVDLTPNEFQLLSYLIENQDKAVSREELLNRIWGYESVVETRVADDTVKRLRKKIAHSSVVVETVWGYGFRLKEREQA